MIKLLKISGTEINIKEIDTTHEDFEGRFCPPTNSIEMGKDLQDTAYDKTLIHEMVHAITHNTSLIHTSVHPDVWEVIAHEFSEALCNNFKLVKK